MNVINLSLIIILLSLILAFYNHEMFEISDIETDVISIECKGEKGPKGPTGSPGKLIY
tara:strand:- start:241 stop:414 length:174 start_codon:yes stop_codon:yes gene_type:complete